MLDDMDRAKIVSVSQIQPVLTPEKPAKPQKPLFIGIGLLVGLLAAGGVVVVAVAAQQHLHDGGRGRAAAAPPCPGHGPARRAGEGRDGLRRWMNLGWYRRRLSRMSAGEVAVRAQTALRQAAWRPRGAGGPALRAGRLLPGGRRCRAVLPPWRGEGEAVSAARGDLLAYADRLLRLCRSPAGGQLAGLRRRAAERPGRAGLVPRSADRQTGAAGHLLLRRAASPGDIVGDLKHVWEPSRHQATCRWRRPGG